MKVREIKKIIDRLVWIIPFRSIRDNIRKLIIYFIDKLETIKAQNKAIIKLLTTNDSYVIVSICGGFADQLAHLIFGKELEALYNKKVKYDISTYDEEGYTHDCLGIKNRKFLLKEIFDDLEIVSREEALCVSEIMRVTKDNVNEMDELLNKYKLLYFDADISYSNYLNNKNGSPISKILNDMGLQEKIFPKLDAVSLKKLDSINKAEVSVAVHIRRGDVFKFLGIARGGKWIQGNIF